MFDLVQHYTSAAQCGSPMTGDDLTVLVYMISGSILFASWLYIKTKRDAEVKCTGIQMIEAMRTGRIYFNSFPQPYSDKLHTALDAVMEAYIDCFCKNNVNGTTLRKLTPLVEECIQTIHEVSAQPNQRGAAIGEAYGAMNRIREHQTTLIVSVQRPFPLFVSASLTALVVMVVHSYFALEYLYLYNSASNIVETFATFYALFLALIVALVVRNSLF